MTKGSLSPARASWPCIWTVKMSNFLLLQYHFSFQLKFTFWCSQEKYEWRLNFSLDDSRIKRVLLIQRMHNIIPFDFDYIELVFNVLYLTEAAGCDSLWWSRVFLQPALTCWLNIEQWIHWTWGRFQQRHTLPPFQPTSQHIWGMCPLHASCSTRPFNRRMHL